MGPRVAAACAHASLAALSEDDHLGDLENDESGSENRYFSSNDLLLLALCPFEVEVKVISYGIMHLIT